VARRRYLVAYDICEPKRLRRICKTMEEYGERLQYSVFICDLSRTELIRARTAVEREMDLTEDSVVIVNLGETHNARFTFVGQRRDLPTTGARII
jgi:CRISPR-associated protein Cas2